MDTLSKIPSEGNWPDVARALNENFTKVGLEFVKVGQNTEVYLPLCASVEEATAKIPHPKFGQTILVGTVLPAPIYKWNGTEWIATGGTGGGTNIPLDNYPTKEELNTALTKRDEKISNLENGTYILSQVLDTSKGSENKVLSLKVASENIIRLKGSTDNLEKEVLVYQPAISEHVPEYTLKEGAYIDPNGYHPAAGLVHTSPIEVFEGDIVKYHVYGYWLSAIAQVIDESKREYRPIVKVMDNPGEEGTVGTWTAPSHMFITISSSTKGGTKNLEVTLQSQERKPIKDKVDKLMKECVVTVEGVPVPLDFYEKKNGYINAQGGVSTQYGGSYFKYRLPLLSKTIYITGYTGVDANKQWALAKFVDAKGDNKGVRISDKNRYDKEIINVPDGAVEVHVNAGQGGVPLTVSCTTSDGVSKLLPGPAFKLLMDMIENNNAEYLNHWKGKQWYAYGTSITSVKQGKYVQQLESLSGLIAHNKGIPGGGITNNGGYSAGQVKSAIMNTTDGKLEADLITLEVGPNEGKNNGDIFDISDETFCGCLNQCIRYLQENTTAQIVVIASVATKNEPSTSKEYYQKMKLIHDVCTINRCYCIDGNSGLGYARIKSGKYNVDDIHQNDIGGYIYAKSIWAVLKDIPVFDKSIS